MLKSLYPLINWDIIRIAGFDLDGTLYDEMDFIMQVYKPISDILAKLCNSSPEQISGLMSQRWLMKGSSYDLIFAEVLSNHGINGAAAEAAVTECLAVYRGYKPQMCLPPRVSFIMDYMKNNYDLFLISDGNSSLQMEKFTVLGLARWISSYNVGFTGLYGLDFAKPSIKIIDKISALQQCKLPESVVYFGDRDIDKQFAAAAGFQFVSVQGLISSTK
jgi:FMN phosphatase YigB (HAD superfamily)